MSEDNRDTVLWNAFRQGNRQAFERLYQEYYAALYHYGHTITPETDIVRDGIQTLFIDLWRRRTHLRDTDQVKPYLYRGLRRLLVKDLQRQRKPYPPDFYLETVLPSHEACTIGLETTDLRKKKLLEAVQTLTPKQREVIHLRFYENLDNEAIATLMNITVNTVYNLASLAISNLRSQLKSQKELFILLLLTFFN